MIFCTQNLPIKTINVELTAEAVICNNDLFFRVTFQENLTDDLVLFRIAFKAECHLLQIN